MKAEGTRIGRGATALALAAAIAAFAAAPMAAQESTAPPFIYVTYFECEASSEWRADEIAETVFGPAYDAVMEEGGISAWGWLEHHTGSHWRRALYLMAPTMEGALNAVAAVNDKASETNPRAAEEFGSICGRHEDYVWRGVVGSDVTSPVDRGEVGFSTYFDCDSAREQRADELVQDVIGPLYNEQVEAGKLVTWGWSEHIVGGQWRRLATATATNTGSLMEARAAIIENLFGSHAEAGEEFNSICGSHQDYIWNIGLQKP